MLLLPSVVRVGVWAFACWFGGSGGFWRSGWFWVVGVILSGRDAQYFGENDPEHESIGMLVMNGASEEIQKNKKF